MAKKDTRPSLIGKWKVTNVADSSTAGLKGTSFFQGFNPDTSNISVTFNADRSLILASASKPANDTEKYYTDVGKHYIFARLNTDSKPDTFVIKTLNDTLLQVATDSVYFQLKKLP